jgi:hypothetical protein
MKLIKIGFVLLSNTKHAAPSTRIAVLNMLPFLRKAGFDPQIVFEPKPGADSKTPDVSGVLQKIQAEGIRIVLIQKVRGASILELVHQLSAVGVKTVYQVCDLVDPKMAYAADITTTTTEYLKTLYPSVLQDRIRVVHDGIENGEMQKTQWSKHHCTRWNPLKAILVTSLSLDDLPVLSKPPEWLSVTIVGKYSPGRLSMRRMREIRWNFSRITNSSKRLAYLRFLSNPRIRLVSWDPVTVYEHMKNADIGIIPVDTSPDIDSELNQPSFWQVKSENRLSMKMCVGLPVIATPIPSYEPLIDQGRNGFLANSLEEWMGCLNTLRNPDLRREIGEQARASVVSRFSMDEQARLLIEVLREVLEI